MLAPVLARNHFKSYNILADSTRRTDFGSLFLPDVYVRMYARAFLQFVVNADELIGKYHPTHRAL